MSKKKIFCMVLFYVTLFLIVCIINCATEMILVDQLNFGVLFYGAVIGLVIGSVIIIVNNLFSKMK